MLQNKASSFHLSHAVVHAGMVAGFIWCLVFGVWCFINLMLPLSVLLPTRNSMSLLPKHIVSMQPWLQLAQEVVAVDSHSEDGTREFLERELRHPNVRVLSHPPGLYQSWNFGIQQCRGKYVYVSTVGDTITREGIELLASAAEQLAAEVVVSPPRMVRDDRPEERRWPVHGLVEDRQLRNPIRFSPLETFTFAFVNLRKAILGSSASNLYRTDLLQRLPFPTDFLFWIW